MDLKEAVDRSSSSEFYNFPEIFTDKTGLIKVPELGVQGKPSWTSSSLNQRKRKVLLEISSFRGIASNARHYYGHLLVDGVYTADIDQIQISKNLTFSDERKYPVLLYRYILDIKRPVTMSEIEQNPDRWQCYEEGDMTDAYESKIELISDVKKILKLRFKGDWLFRIQHPNGDIQDVEFEFDPIQLYTPYSSMA